MKVSFIGTTLRSQNSSIRAAVLSNASDAKSTDIISKGCRETQKCGRCGGNHISEGCNIDTNTKSRQCAACNGGAHASWSLRCPAWKSEADRAKRARASCPRLYPVSTRKAQGLALDTSASQPEPTQAESDSDDPAWEVVDEERKGGRR